MLTVATWNVLHRIHAENWGEAVPQQWPDERERIAAITSAIAALDAQVIALQEVSGDQLTSLRDLPRTLLAFRYARVPAPKLGRSVLRDPAEYLVLLVDGRADEVAAESFATDPGKGLLAARVGALTVIDTHVSFGERAASQLRRLAMLAAASPGPAIVLGDFNAARDVVAAGLGPEFVAEDPGPSVPTRPRTGDATKATTIDHVFGRGTSPFDTRVLDVGGRSDHNLVLARVRS